MYKIYYWLEKYPGCGEFLEAVEIIPAKNALEAVIVLKERLKKQADGKDWVIKDCQRTVD